MNVLLVVDCYGWAFDNIARGIQKYSEHSCVIRIPSEINSRDINDCSVVISLDEEWTWNKISKRRKLMMKRNDLKTIVLIHNIMKHFPDPEVFDIIVPTNRNLLAKAKRIYPKANNIKLMFSGADTELFKETEMPRNFRAGWTGSYNCPIKRTHLLKHLDYEVLTMGNDSSKFLVKNRSQNDIRDFYNSISVLVCLSKAEGGPLPPIEAASCGRAVVSTSMGQMPDLLEKQWLVPVDKPVKLMNEKLKLLKEDFELLKKTGKRNATEVRKNWSWKVRAKQWDRLIEEVVNGKS